MPTDDVIETLRQLLPELRQEFGVLSIQVFGSFARGEGRPDSDVDVLVEYDTVPGLHSYFGLAGFLEERLGRRVDLTTRGGLHPALKDRILAEAVDVA